MWEWRSEFEGTGSIICSAGPALRSCGFWETFARQLWERKIVRGSLSRPRQAQLGGRKKPSRPRQPKRRGTTRRAQGHARTQAAPRGSPPDSGGAERERRGWLRATTSLVAVAQQNSQAYFASPQQFSSRPPHPDSSGLPLLIRGGEFAGRAPPACQSDRRPLLPWRGAAFQALTLNFHG